MLKEADLAFRQGFALCPDRPEAVFRYVQLLLQLARLDDALLVAETCLKLDPDNGQVRGLVENIKAYKKQSAGMKQARAGTLTAAQAEALAVRLANEKAQALYNCQPFRSGRPAEWVQGSWVWRDLRAQGTFDIEATVKFAADGTNPDVNVTMLDSHLSPLR